MAFDVVIPSGNEKEFIARALDLGYDELVFLIRDTRYTKQYSGLVGSTLKIKTAYMLHDLSEIQKLKGKFDYLFAVADRKFFESKVDFMIDSELSDRKDSFHYKATSLNQVHAELSKINDSTIVFSFNNLLRSPSSIFGKMSQNAVLVKKYSLKHSVFSMASRPEDMRSRTILDALGTVLGI
jgi:hypothetical protein